MGRMKDEEIYHRAIHRKVLLVYVVSEVDWTAYVLPVEGRNHAQEVGAWRAEGAKLIEDDARAFWTSLVRDLDVRELKYRR